MTKKKIITPTYMKPYTITIFITITTKTVKGSKGWYASVDKHNKKYSEYIEPDIEMCLFIHYYCYFLTGKSNKFITVFVIIYFIQTKIYDSLAHVCKFVLMNLKIKLAINYTIFKYSNFAP